MSKTAVNVLVVLIDFYRATFAGVLGGRCRFTPSCSCYSREALKTFGFRKGTFLALKRLSRCHPWGGHGFDPVKPVESK